MKTKKLLKMKKVNFTICNNCTCCWWHFKLKVKNPMKINYDFRKFLVFKIISLAQHTLRVISISIYFLKDHAELYLVKISIFFLYCTISEHFIIIIKRLGSNLIKNNHIYYAYKLYVYKNNMYIKYFRFNSSAI